ncbi:MAG: hypothetical protein HOV80_23810 [Polyangiaceae bacterium]|nr:hypothetical protein [Polyangiaceae bacterium]
MKAWTLAIAVATTLAASVAQAEPTAKEEPACSKLEELGTIESWIGAAGCYLESGKLASAHSAFRQAASMAKAEGEIELARVAQDQALDLVSRIPLLTLKVSAELAALPGLRIERDGFGVSAALFNARVPVDGGKHTIVVTAPGMTPIRKTIEVPVEGGAVSVDLALPVDAPPAAAPAKPRATAKAKRQRRGLTVARRVLFRTG